MIGMSPSTSQSFSSTTSPSRSSLHGFSPSSSVSCTASPVLSQQIAFSDAAGGGGGSVAAGAASTADAGAAAASTVAGGGGGGAADPEPDAPLATGAAGASAFFLLHPIDSARTT